MATDIELAIMAGRAYQSSRNEANWFSTPEDWSIIDHRDMPSGFEGVSFQRGDEIVISFAGTYSGDIKDWYANILLGPGGYSQQLQDAAEYYLQIKASNPGAKITLTGHSLGGGLASLIAVFFNENAVTFDQAPFRAVASVHTPESPDLDPYRFLLFALQDNEGIDQSLLQPLEEYVAEVDLSNMANILQEREINVINTRVDGEFLTADLPFSILDGIGSTPAENILAHGGTDISSGELHSIALLTVNDCRKETSDFGYHEKQGCPQGKEEGVF